LTHFGLLGRMPLELKSTIQKSWYFGSLNRDDSKPVVGLTAFLATSLDWKASGYGTVDHFTGVSLDSSFDPWPRSGQSTKGVARMLVSPRRLSAVSLGLAGLFIIANTTSGQQQAREAQAAPRTSTAGPATFGSIDMGAVFKGYEKVKVTNEEFIAAVGVKKKELQGVLAQMEQVGKEIGNFKPGSEDYKKAENKLTQLKAQSEAGREQAEREFSLREAEMIGTIYKEIQSMVIRVAKQRNLTYVLRTSNDPITSNDPSSPIRAIERTVVYADPSNDITEAVVQYLNMEYKSQRQGAGTPAPATGNTSATQSRLRPTGN